VHLIVPNAAVIHALDDRIAVLERELLVAKKQRNALVLAASLPFEVLADILRHTQHPDGFKNARLPSLGYDRKWARMMLASTLRCTRLGVWQEYMHTVERIHATCTLRLICRHPYFPCDSLGRSGLSKDTTISSGMSVFVSTTNPIPGTPRAPDTSTSGMGPPQFDVLSGPLITARTFLRELRLASTSAPETSDDVQNAHIVMKEHEYTGVPMTSALTRPEDKHHPRRARTKKNGA
jgi:hypothetical protein